MKKIIKDNEVMSIENIEDKYNQINKKFRLKQQELNQYDKEISNLDKEIKLLKETRDDDFKSSSKEVEIVLSALMALAQLLVQASFFTYAYPKCLAINDITIQTIAAMIGAITSAAIAIGSIKISNKIVDKGVEVHAQNKLKSKEYQQLNQKILNKEIEKEQKSNEASKIRKETLILALNDCKCLIASINKKEAAKTMQTINCSESQEAIPQLVSKPIKKIRIINRRN